MHFSDRSGAATDLFPGMFELHEARFGARRRAGEQWFLDVGVAEPIVRPHVIHTRDSEY